MLIARGKSIMTLPFLKMPRSQILLDESKVAARVIKTAPVPNERPAKAYSLRVFARLTRSPKKRVRRRKPIAATLLYSMSVSVILLILSAVLMAIRIILLFAQRGKEV